MGKWHNGPNGPGACKATKRGCPYGGEDKHYDSKEEAMKAYDLENEAEFGMIPKLEENKNKWNTIRHYDPKGEMDEETTVRKTNDKNVFEFYSRIMSVDKMSHIISKGTVDLRDKRINKKAVEEMYGTKFKDAPEVFVNNVISYYGGTEFDNDPVYLNARKQNIDYEVNKIKGTLGVPKDGEQEDTEIKYAEGWDPKNQNSWEGFDSYNPVGDSNGEVYVRPSSKKNKIEFFSVESSNNGTEYIISKGTIDIKEDGIDQKEVEEYSGVLKKDDEVAHLNAIVQYYDGKTFDKDPIILKTSDYDDINEKIESVKRQYGI